MFVLDGEYINMLIYASKDGDTRIKFTSKSFLYTLLTSGGLLRRKL